MSDRYPAEIYIGGVIPRRVLDTLVRKITEAGVSLNGYDDDCATEDEIRAALKEGNTLDLYDCRAAYGHFDELEKFLIQHGIHFNHHSEACYEYDAENTYYRGGKILTMAATQSGECLLPVTDILEVLNNHELDDFGKLEALTRLAVPPETKPLEPIQCV